MHLFCAKYYMYVVTSQHYQTQKFLSFYVSFLCCHFGFSEKEFYLFLCFSKVYTVGLKQFKFS